MTNTSTNEKENAPQARNRVCVVWDRTSGDEHEDQDARAQVAATAQRFREAGFDVAETFYDEDVPGDVPWAERRGMQRALAAARKIDAALATRSPSRLWRGRPAQGIVLCETIPDLVILGKSHWERRGGAWVNDADGDELYRFIDLHQAWTTKRGIREETQHVMDEIKAGRRATRSGRPHHRPPIQYEAAHLEAAREVYARTGRVTDAWREMLRQRGYDAVKDERTKKARFISRAKVGQLLGVYSVTKPSASESPRDAA